MAARSGLASSSSCVSPRRGQRCGEGVVGRCEDRERARAGERLRESGLLHGGDEDREVRVRGGDVDDRAGRVHGGGRGRRVLHRGRGGGRGGRRRRGRRLARGGGLVVATAGGEDETGRAEREERDANGRGSVEWRFASWPPLRRAARFRMTRPARSVTEVSNQRANHVENSRSCQAPHRPWSGAVAPRVGPAAPRRRRRAAAGAARPTAMLDPEERSTATWTSPTPISQIGRLLRSERVERVSVDAMRQRHVCGRRLAA